MATMGLGVTIGSYSLRAVKVRKKGEGYIVQRVFSDRLNEDTRPVAGRALAARGIKGQAATIGLTGRDVIIRYSQVPPVPEWRLRNLMKYEVEEVGSQSGGHVSADYRKLELPDPDGDRVEDAILVALARNTYLDQQVEALSAGGIAVAGASPNSVALFNAFAANATYTETETTLLVNIGAEDVDIAIQQGGELLFARNAVPGGKAFTEAIEQAFATSFGKAEQMKLAKADVTPKAEARYPDAAAEKVANAIVGVAGQLASQIQSTLMIARAQTKVSDLKVDKAYIAGGGASLKGLDKYLKQALGVDVERLDPFAISDISGLPDDEREMAEKAPWEFAVPMGLAQAYLAAEAFPLTVLPAALRAKRDFMQKGIWAVGAGLVALAILAILYTGRTGAADVAHKGYQRMKKVRNTTTEQDKRYRRALYEAQDLQAKHAVLADLAAPGAVLGRVLEVLEANAKGLKEVYLQEVTLRVQESPFEFPVYVPKNAAKYGTGYSKVSRTRELRRTPTVTVKGRIAAAQDPTGIHQKFVQGCQGNEAGLLVEQPQRLKQSRGKDGTFELLFRPGTVVELMGEDREDAGTVTLTDLAFDDPDDPRFLLGRGADGVRVKFEKDRINRRQWKGFQKTLIVETPSEED